MKELLGKVPEVLGKMGWGDTTFQLHIRGDPSELYETACQEWLNISSAVLRDLVLNKPGRKGGRRKANVADVQATQATQAEVEE